MKMSNSGNPNGINTHCNSVGPRDGTRVVLREITATLQNSPPMQTQHRKAASNTTPTGKTEHEIKVQFTREFVDAGASDSRPESLSSASSFQSLASTLSNNNGGQTTPVTPQKLADASYVNPDISGLDDLIAGCRNIHLDDKTDTEKSNVFQSLADNTLIVATTENSLQLTNTVQNLSQEEAFTSAINDSLHLDGTHDESSDYKEACETSTSLNNTRETTFDLKLDDSHSKSVRDSSHNPIGEELTTDRIKDTSDIPQSSVNNSALEIKNSSVKYDVDNATSLIQTPDLAPSSVQLDNNSLRVQTFSQSLNSSQDLVLNETNELIVNCNSTFNNINLNKSEELNLSHNISNGDNDTSIDPNSQIATDVTENQPNELSIPEVNKIILTLNDPSNLPPELDIRANKNISTSNIRSLCYEKPGLSIETPGDPEAPKKYTEEISIAQRSQIITEQHILDSSENHLTNAISVNTNQIDVANLSSPTAEILQNISAKFSKESIVQEGTQQVVHEHSVSTEVTDSVDQINVQKNFEELNSSQPQGIPAAVHSVVQEISDTIIHESELQHSKDESLETSIKQLPIKIENSERLEADLQAVDKVVPCIPQDSVNHLQKFEKLESEESTRVDIDVTPFPGNDLDIYQNSALNPKGDLNESNTVEEDLNKTVTIKEGSFQSIDSFLDGASENYNAFQPQQQSTNLNGDCNFEKLELAAQVIAEEIRNKSLELTEDSDQFFNGDSDLILDPASFDFLLTRNNTKNTIRDLGAESLYVKFDPLVSNVNMLPQGPPQVADGEEDAKNSIPQPTLDTPKRNPALAAIDRLLFYSPVTGTPNKVEEPPKIKEEIVKEIIPESVPVIDENMAKELELVRSTVLQLESQLEKERRKHEEELGKESLKYKNLKEELVQEVQKKNEMTMVMDEYEKSLSRQMADRERERASFAQERAKLQEELQAANHHLGNTEAAFNDVHSKYERLKSVVSAYKSNEAVLKESVQENIETIKTLEARYEQLKNHAISQLENANLELEAIRKQHETETVRLQAMIRKAELKSNSLAEMVEQKSKENKELAAILDEVIARVGQNPE